MASNWRWPFQTLQIVKRPIRQHPYKRFGDRVTSCNFKLAQIYCTRCIWTLTFLMRSVHSFNPTENNGPMISVLIRLRNSGFQLYPNLGWRTVQETTYGPRIFDRMTWKSTPLWLRATRAGKKSRTLTTLKLEVTKLSSKHNTFRKPKLYK